MNYLTHIHIAHSTDSSLRGNFLRDFVNGSDLTAQPEHLRKGIVIDVHFDHLLCQFWNQFETPDLHLMLDEFYQELRTSELSLDGLFNQVDQRLLQHQWLSDYQEFSSVIRAYHQLLDYLNLDEQIQPKNKNKYPNPIHTE